MEVGIPAHCTEPSREVLKQYGKSSELVLARLVFDTIALLLSTATTATTTTTITSTPATTTVVTTTTATTTTATTYY